MQKGKAAAKTIQKAQVLLASDEAVGPQSETTSAFTYHHSVHSVERIRKVFCEGGLALFEPQAPQPRSDKNLQVKSKRTALRLLAVSLPWGKSLETTGHC